METPTLEAECTQKIRKRKKQQFNEIRKQMEFYFSDANLAKDRFLKKLVVDDPNVSLDVFMSFNKMKKIVDSVDDIAKALTKSDFLKLSEDRRTVCRVTPMNESASVNVDERTIYVESLPLTTTHESLRTCFEQYGPVAYVSLPKYATSKRIKEFGFVEFEQISSVIKTLNAFSKFGGLLNLESEPENLVSIVSYLKEQQMLSEQTVNQSNPTDQANTELNEDDDGEEIVSNADEQSETTSATRSENLDDFDGPPAKQMKLSDADVKDHDEHAEESHTKKTRRRKTSSKNNRNIDSVGNPLKSVRSLRICTKIEWKRLRNKYLNEQHQQRILLKQQWKSNKPIAPSQPMKKIVQNPRKINFYNANKEDVKEIDSNKIESIKTPTFTYEPGVIVKVFFDEPCTDITEFKQDMRSQSFVKYVDVEESQAAAFIRVDKPNSAPTLIKHCAPNRCQILTGDNESDYWHKIEMDWKNKISKNVKVAKKKGRDKLAKVIATHIRFDE